MVPVMHVTVFSFRACLVAVEPNWKMALRLSLTLAGSYSSCAARAAKPKPNVIAIIANATKRRISSPESRLILHLREAQLRLLRSELGGLLVPEPSRFRIGRDAARVLCAEHGRIVGLRQDERGLCL